MATYGSITVKYSGSNVTLNDIQLVEIEQGRQFTTDPYSASRMIIHCRNLSGWGATPPKIGQRIYMTQTLTGLSATEVWGGRIRGVNIQYGNKTSMDTAVITCEGSLGLLARRQLKSVSLTQQDTTSQADQAITASGVPVTVFYDTGYSIASAQTYTGNLLDLVNELMLTEYGRISQFYNFSTYTSQIYLHPRNTLDSGNFYYATDVDPAPTNRMILNGVSFAGVQDNYYTQVTINPQGLTPQVATSGGSYFGLTQASLDYTNAQALSHAQYLLANFNNDTSELIGCSLKWSQQNTSSARSKFDLLCQAATQISSPIEVTFRGTTYYAIIEGVRFTYTMDDIEVELDLTPQDLNAYLILNDSRFGKLDENKLGF